ncbi:phosphate ABC transporter permease subunit PstC [Aureimonas fodinaquatilis]|uniref:Phosphate transport system permease protein n=1 Tax=Aureimonas fodinaquatilis TaxID=2565783 RepID=A0A5B0E3S3_9HYPH|nr:phosphate ABC transporter permease subunit PstC [Aureimonas fodinaquatilis]KAA0972420.1 phosphate ABC transporter permease subunit PstC [Aureimonas fodinaquatilis]
MSTLSIIFAVLLIGVAGFFLGYAKSRRIAADASGKLHSRPVYHGSYVFSFSAVPALALLSLWVIISPILIGADISSRLAEVTEGASSNLAPSIVRSIASGISYLPPDQQASLANAGVAELRPLLTARGVPLAADAQDYMVPLAQHQLVLENRSMLAMSVSVLALALAGAALAYSRIALRLRARNSVESVVRGFLIAASSIAILTTVGIVFSMLFESLDFFSRIPPAEFFFGTVWEPRFAAAGSNVQGQFGLIPLLLGTLYIAFVAMVFAVPVGLFAAIYMAEYASRPVRSVVKPLLEVLAGIPTIVYGFFALITVGPFLRDLSAQLNGLLTGDYSSFIQAQSVLTAGLVMGIMLIPFVSSLSDDIITSVPRALRDGSLGLGATRSETVRRVILPAALPGIVSALLLTASRAIGETMIVVLAAGIAANITINPFEAMTTVTIKIVSQLTGDLDFTSPQSLVAFALGITLFVMTLMLNIFALYIVRKYREQYE